MRKRELNFGQMRIMSNKNIMNENVKQHRANVLISRLLLYLNMLLLLLYPWWVIVNSRMENRNGDENGNEIANFESVQTSYLNLKRLIAISHYGTRNPANFDPAHAQITLHSQGSFFSTSSICALSHLQNLPAKSQSNMARGYTHFTKGEL